MKQLLLIIALFIFITDANAQKEVFDVITYKPIKGWKKERTDKYVSFSTADEAKGTFCLVSIYRSADGNPGFEQAWQSVVQEPFAAGAPKMEETSVDNGWTLQTGSAPFNKEGLSGTAMLIMATGGGKMINMLVLVNSDVYSSPLQDFIGALELKNVAAAPVPTSTTTATPLVGLWRINHFETNGAYHSGGYFRKEYTFNSDGTYLFLEKNFSASFGKVIFYVYETGTWSASGNTLTVTPIQGRMEEWAKPANGRTEEFGKLVRTNVRKLEKVTYRYEIKYYAGSQSSALELYFDRETEREGRPSRISFAGAKESIIVRPPGR